MVCFNIHDHTLIKKSMILQSKSIVSVWFNIIQSSSFVQMLTFSEKIIINYVIISIE